MKKIFFYFVALLIAGTFAFNNASAQVDVSTGGPVTTYANIKLAFDAINAGTHTGAITISITGAGTYTDPAAPAILNSSGVGSASYTSVLIRPTADGVTISGTTATGRGVIELNAADNVTIDGDNPNTGGTNRNLTIVNLAASTITYTSAVRIMTAITATYTSADNITIKNCIITGSAAGRMLSTATSTTGSENTTFGIYAGAGAGVTPTAITSVTTNSAVSGTTINSFLVDNNSVNACARGIVFNGAVATVSSGVTVSNNTMGDQGTPSPATPPYTSPTTTIYTKCIWINGASAVTVTGNAIKNIMSYVATTTSGIELAGAIGTSVNISSNTINNLTVNATSSAPKGILVTSATGTYTISKNIINNTQSMGGSSGAAGIDASGTVTSATIELNRITTVYNRNTGTWGASGIIFGGTAVTVKNNTVSDLKMDITGGAAFSTTFGVHGIRCNAGTNHKVYHNSVNLFGAMFGAAATNILSSAFCIVGTGQTGITVYNNFFMNRLSGGTTGSTAHVGIYLPSAGTSAMNLTINNNAYFCGTDATSQGIGQAGTTASAPTYLTLAALKVYSATLNVAGTNDNASQGFSTTSFAPLTSDVDFHIPAGTSTSLESGGISQVTTGVTTDYDQPTPDVRPGPAGSIYGGAVAPDIGADEFDGANNLAPSISYSPLGNTTSTSNRNLNGVTITDADGVNNTTFKPRIYYKKSTAPNTVAGWQFQQSTGTYDFTIDYSLIGGVSTGDIIQYFIVAQDLNSIPAVAINSGAFAAAPSSVALTSAAFPIGGTINQYKIVGAPLSGDYTVGQFAFNRFTGKNITFERVVTKTMKEVYEPSQIDNNNSKSQIIDNTSLSAVNFRKVMKEVEEVKFVPMENGKEYNGDLFVKRSEDPNLPLDAGLGVYATLTAAVTDLNDRGVSGPVRFLLKDATYSTGETFPIVINTISGGSSVNTLTIQPDSAASTITGSVASALLKLNGADYVTIDGLNTGGKSLTFNNTNTGGVNLWVGSANASDGATNNTFKNITSIGPSIVGIISGSGTTLGNDAEAPNSDNKIQNCTTKGTQNGFYLRGNPTTLDQNWLVSQNNCGSSVDAEKHSFRGMALINSQNFTVSNNNIVGILSTTSSSATMQAIGLYTNINGGTINANKMGDIYQQNTVGWGAAGVYLGATTTASNVTVSNNFIWNVRGYGYNGVLSSDNGYGIMVDAGGGYNLYFNTISMLANQTTVGGNSACINVSSAVTTANSLNIRDNILSNLQTVGANRYAVYSGALATVYADINYNDYYFGAAPNLGYLGADRSNLAAWQTATGKDANSSSVLANFVSATTGDLHLTGASIGDINLLGTPIAGITTDIDGNTRGAVKPYMGADEASGLSGLTLKLNWEACPNPSAVTVQIRNSSSPYAVVESVNGTAGGNVSSVINFGNAADATPYYIVVKSVNSVETWSATPVTFTSHAASYDFTTAINQAYGNNQKLSGGIPSIYQGDANQDGYVDQTDLVTLTYGAITSNTTSPATDYNCDGTTDLTDLILDYNNASSFVQVQRP